MAGKKKITQEYIDEATKDELIDIAGRLGIEDKVHYKMLKAELYNLVLTEFLEQEEAKRAPTPESTKKAASEAPAETPEKSAFTYAIVKDRVETHIPAGNLKRLLRQLAIKAFNLRLLKQRAMRDGEASVRKLRRTRARNVWITFIVRYS